MILVTGTIDVDPAQREAFVEAARAVMGATRVEDGCEHYAFSADVDDPGRFHISERWASQEAADTHTASAHLATFMATIGPLVRGGTLTKWSGATGEKLF